jgi:hypothetical protein
MPPAAPGTANVRAYVMLTAEALAVALIAQRNASQRRLRSTHMITT